MRNIILSAILVILTVYSSFMTAYYAGEHRWVWAAVAAVGAICWLFNVYMWAERKSVK